MDVGISLICSLHCGCTPWLYTVVVHCGCTLAVHWLCTVAVHCGCTLWLYTVAVHCGCTLWLYTVVVHCGCTLWLYTAQWSWLCTSCVKIPLHYAGYAVDLNKAARHVAEVSVGLVGIVVVNRGHMPPYKQLVISYVIGCEHRYYNNGYEVSTRHSLPVWTS